MKAKKQNVFLNMIASKKEILLEWSCRRLMTLDVCVIIAGYISFIQTQYTLDSPLIPTSIVYDIVRDSGKMKVSLISGAIFLIGLWF